MNLRRLPCFVVGTAYGDLTMTDAEANGGRLSKRVAALLDALHPTGKGTCECHVGGPSSKREIYYDPAVRFNIKDVIANDQGGRFSESKLMVEHGKTPEYGERAVGKMSHCWVEGNRLKAEFEIFDPDVASELRSGRYVGFSPKFHFDFEGDRVTSIHKWHHETSLTADPVYSSCRTFDVVASKVANPSVASITMQTIEQVNDRSVKDSRNKFLDHDKETSSNDLVRDTLGPSSRPTLDGMEINNLPPTNPSNPQHYQQPQPPTPGNNATMPSGFVDPTRGADPRGADPSIQQQQQRSPAQIEDERIKQMSDRKKAKHNLMKQKLAEFEKAEDDRRLAQEEESKRYAETQEPQKTAFLEYYAKAVGKNLNELNPIEIQAISSSMTDPKLTDWGRGLAIVMRENASLQSRLEKVTSEVNKLSEKRQSLKRKIADERSVSKAVSSKRLKANEPLHPNGGGGPGNNLFGTHTPVPMATGGHAPLTAKNSTTGSTKTAPIDNLFGIPVVNSRTMAVEAGNYVPPRVQQQHQQPSVQYTPDQEEWRQMLRNGSTISLEADPRKLAGLDSISQAPDYGKYFR